MGTILLNTEEEIRSSLRENRMETVTILIPEKTWLRYGEIKARDLPKRIPEFLCTYGKYLSNAKRLNDQARKTLYQPSSETSHMRRVNVRLSTASWALLGLFAQAHGVSRCYLFNYLLWLEEVEVGDSIVEMMNAGTPTFHRSYSYIFHLDLTHSEVYRRLRCDPESIFYAADSQYWNSP
ncbi:DUF1564 domain-containing protein [Leptospira gomenensis]|uniref:DUF1564 domain-containing protein n=1 Tax=Leptospira gomenensis TaxID=2484974 RepID=A0A5F1YES1_9LEPT|nr:DUF1564 domain-containing protein [Leptospira gomenensis]TGK36068.1 DUF1564 domain-containing protein [Leptospira gomenensis]TGK41814.1 DUF1564 domain-containing protein [Leptospira gomenensis]TGK53329.1 DUF1564 domain-containing protein [Leptospira gomenensis]TGK64935.1 DUF1564 domain-containing protein [Leptospira gomenensis]